jgi:hypothetical protein
MFDHHRQRPFGRWWLRDATALPPVLEGAMPDQPTSSSIRPCAKCGGPSDVRLIMPSADKPNHDEFFFKCRACGNTETVYVEQP